MADLKALCVAAGMLEVRTYIASGNVVFESASKEAAIVAALERELTRFAGTSPGVLVRSGAEMADVLAGNPFPGAPGNRTVAIFLPVPGTLEGITGLADEEVRLGRREIYVRYGDGMAKSRLRIPAAKIGTARNMNTVKKLAEMAGTP